MYPLVSSLATYPFLPFKEGGEEPFSREVWVQKERQGSAAMILSHLSFLLSERLIKEKEVGPRR